MKSAINLAKAVVNKKALDKQVKQANAVAKAMYQGRKKRKTKIVIYKPKYPFGDDY